MTEEEATAEGAVLHFDFTYRAVGGIYVDAPVAGEPEKRHKTELAYVLGSVLGSKGCVLSSVIGSTETWENVKDAFEMAFQKTKRPPEEIWVDVGRWGQRLLALVTLHFGTTHTRCARTGAISKSFCSRTWTNSMGNMER